MTGVQTCALPISTFFVLGQNVEKYPEIIERMKEEGHIIGNHTYSHIQLRSANRQQFRDELVLTNESISGITGQEVQYVRPPYGTWDKKLEEELNMFPVLWNVDPNDWCTGNADKVTKNIVNKAKENCIILLHDCYQSSVDAALASIDILTQEGYEFVTVEDMIKKLVPMTLEGCVVRISDIIAYIGRDIEDALRMGVIKEDDIPRDITHVLGVSNRQIIKIGRAHV